MGSTWGNILKISLFGESHGDAVGVVIDGFPHGFKVDRKRLEKEMSKRSPGGYLVSKRVEKDEVNIISGMLEGYTTGMPICLLIRNMDIKSGDYRKNRIIPRPATSDITAIQKYEGFNDLRGSGHFSGRLTAPLVAAGTLAGQYLEEKFKVKIESSLDLEELLKEEHLNDKDNGNINKIFEEYIEETARNKDSVGIGIKIKARGVRAGLGAPIFENAESRIASIFFAVPGVKSVSFGLGHKFAGAYGSEVNDAPVIKGNEIKRKTNNAGGIEGGITNGMDIVAEVVFKPTPSIGKIQDTVNLEEMTETKIAIEGRHDPCIGIRGRFVLEACMALVLLDMHLESSN